MDELYAFLWVKPTTCIGRLFQATDKRAIDGLINGTAEGLADVGRSVLRPTQTGYLYHYAFTMLIALVVGLTYLFWKASH